MSSRSFWQTGIYNPVAVGSIYGVNSEAEVIDVYGTKMRGAIAKDQILFAVSDDMLNSEWAICVSAALSVINIHKRRLTKL